MLRTPFYVSSLSELLTNHLYCLCCLTQYPIRPSTMTYDDVNHLSAKIKPKQQRVKTACCLALSSTNLENVYKYVRGIYDVGGVGNGSQHNESKLLSQQRRADSSECGRNDI